MELGLILTLCGLGAGFLIPALILALIMIRKKKSCTEKTTGLVIDIKTKSTSNGLNFHPIYEYYAEGVRYTGMGTYISHRVPPIGSTISVMYSPSHPKRSYIEGYDNKTFTVLSIVFAIVGCIPIIICACIAVFA